MRTAVLCLVVFLWVLALYFGARLTGEIGSSPDIYPRTPYEINYGNPQTDPFVEVETV